MNRKIPLGPPPAKLDGVYEIVANYDDWDNEFTNAYIVRVGDHDPHRVLVFANHDQAALDEAAELLHETAPGLFTDEADIEFTDDENHEPIDHVRISDTDWYLQDDGSYIAIEPYTDWPVAAYYIYERTNPFREIVTVMKGVIVAHQYAGDDDPAHVYGNYWEPYLLFDKLHAAIRDGFELVYTAS